MPAADHDSFHGPCALSCTPSSCIMLSPVAVHASLPGAAAAARGWTAADGLIEVQPPVPGGGAGDAAAQRSLQRLAEYVVHLEA